MNKKFLSAVLFGALMVGSSVTFTGCIDNDEPAGIETLRGAKAELLRAKVAVEAAEAALRNAYAAEHLAQAKWTEAKAVEQELWNESQRLKNEVEAAKTEKDKAYWAKELAKVEAELEKEKMIWEAERLQAATVLAQAQKDYEDAMKAIELSKNYLSEEELGQLNYVQGEYSYAYAKLYGGAYTRYTASYDETTGKVTWESKPDTVEKGTSAKEKLEAAYNQYSADVKDGDFEDISEIKLNAEVADAKADLAASTAELGIKKEALAALESSETLANWKKVKAEYKAKQDSLNDVVADKTIAANKIVIENSDKAMAMQKALKDAAGFKTNTFKDGKIVQDAKDNAEIEASEALKTKLGSLDFSKAGSYVTYDKTANKFTVALNTANLLGVTRDNKTNGTTTLEKDKLDAEKDNKAPYEYWNENGVKLLDDAIVFNGGKNSEYAKMNKAIDAVIEILNKEKAEIPSLDVEQANKELAAAKEDLTAKEKAKTDATKNWKDAITTWEKAKAYTTEKADKEAVEKAADAYVKAIAEAGKITDNTEKVKAQVKARQAFADAVVKYYNAVNAGPGLTSNTVTLELNKTVGTGKEWITKTVLAWLSDANNKDGYLEALIKYFGLDESTMTADALKVFWSEGEKETVTAGEKPSVNAAAALKKINKVDDVRKALLDASKALYGDIQTLGFYVVNNVEYGRETEPSDAEIKAQWEKTPTQVGACGDVLSAEKRVKTAEESVAQVDQFAAAVKALEEVKATIAKAKVDFMAEAEPSIKAAKDAQTACIDNINAPIQKLGIAADQALNDKIGNVIDAVEGSIGTFNTDLKDEELKETAKYIALIQSLKNEIDNLQTETIPSNESTLIKAEAMLDAYKNGNMSAQHVIEWAQSKVDNVKIAYDSAVSELTYWTEKLKEVTATLYSKSSAE